MKKAFTLAEVLITLSIIGVVAALTIPSLVVKHRKQVVVTKLKRTSSALLQASNMSLLDYGNSEREGFTALNGDTALEMFNKYYTPYMKFLKIEKKEKGVLAYQPDGSVLYFFKNRLDSTDCRGWACTYMIVCMDSKACENIDENNQGNYGRGLIDGKTTFRIYTTGIVPISTFKFDSHDTRIQKCKQKESIEACTALIFEAGWQIPDDYPIKF